MNIRVKMERGKKMSVQTWQDFTTACEQCKACDLWERRRNVVIWRGAVQAPLLFIGEGPGADEDALGKPFVGRSGRLLDMLLTAFGLDESDYHIANIVKCRPPENRQPTDEEVEACKPLLRQQFLYVRPKVIVLLGGVAYRHFTGDETKISQVRGIVKESNGYFVIPTYHPAYILRNNKMREILWSDIALARQKLEDLGELPALTFVPEMPLSHPRKTAGT
ncbi:MAG: uracil-DNA glycosylase [Fastidiosipilaceae bacterium]